MRRQPHPAVALLVVSLPLITLSQEKPAVERLGTLRLRQSQPILCLAWSPDGKVIAGGGHSRYLDIWDVASKEIVRHVRLGDPVQAVAFTPDGSTVIAAAADMRELDPFSRIVAIPLDGSPVRKPPRFGGNVRALAIHPDGETLVTAARGPAGNNILTWWGVEPLESYYQVRESLEGVPTLALSPDGKQIATSAGGEVRIWDEESAKRIRTIPVPGTEDGGYARLIYFPDGKTIAFVRGDDAIHLLDPTTGESRVIRVEKADILTVACSPDGGTIAAGTTRSAVILLDAKSGEQRGVLRRDGPARGHPLAFSPTGDRLADAAGPDSAVHIWDLGTRKEIDPPVGHSGAVTSIAFAEDGRRLVSAGTEGTIRLWDPHGGSELKVFAAEGGVPYRVAISPDGSRIAYGTHTGNVRVIDASTGKCLRGASAPIEGRPGQDPSPSRTAVIALEFVDGNDAILAAVPSGWTGILDLREGETEDRIIQGPPLRSSSTLTLRYPGLTMGHPRQLLALSPDGSRITCFLRGRRIQVLPLDGSTPVDHLLPAAKLPRRRHREDTPGAIALAGDGTKAALISEEGEITVWDCLTESFLPMDPIRRPAHVHTAALSPVGEMIAMSDTVGGILLINACTGRVIRQFQDYGQMKSVELAFSPDGKWLASADLDGLVRLWGLPQAKGDDPAADLDRMWKDLIDPDIAVQHKAVRDLAAAGKPAVGFLEGRTRPGPRPGPDRVQALIRQMDDEIFEVREKATRALESLGPAVEAEIRAAIPDAASPEVRARLQRIAAGYRPPFRSGSRVVLRLVRAMQVLEMIGTEDAAAVLERMVEDSPSEYLRDEASRRHGRVRRRLAPGE